MGRVAALAAVSLTLMACTTIGSLYSAVGDSAVRGDDRLLGTWMAVGEEHDTVRVRVTRSSETQYDLAITDEDGKQYSREGRLVPLGKLWLLEMFSQGEGQIAIEANGGIPTFGHAVIEFDGAILRTAFFDGDKLVAAIREADAARLEYLVRTNETSEYTTKEILLTSPTSELRAGLEHYSRNPVVMGDWVVWHRQ